MGSMPESAIDPAVLEHIEGLIDQDDPLDIAQASCGCSWAGPQGTRWWLCQYHDGMNDGLAMAMTRAADPKEESDE